MAGQLQPNVVITGGFTQCARIASLAHTYNMPIANGGAWIHYNMHLQAGAPNGTLCEYHNLAVIAYGQLANNLPEPQNGCEAETHKRARKPIKLQLQAA